MVFNIDTDFIDPIDLSANGDEVANEWSYVVRNTTVFRYNTTTPISYGTNTFNAFRHNMALSILPESEYRDLVSEANIDYYNGIFTVTYHLDLDLNTLYDYANFKVVNNSDRKYTGSD